jgi:hypothetical protein
MSNDAFTIAWWEKLLSDGQKMHKWLQKLRRTEASGYDDNLQAIRDYDISHSGITRILKKTAEDELRHSDLLIKVLRGRGLEIENEGEDSLYWPEMSKVVNDLDTFAAMCYLGEGLASYRFKIMLNHPGTPADIKEFLSKALPDEMYHEKVFRILTTTDTIARVQNHHENVVQLLKKSQ